MQTAIKSQLNAAVPHAPEAIAWIITALLVAAGVRLVILLTNGLLWKLYELVIQRNG